MAIHAPSLVRSATAALSAAFAFHAARACQPATPDRVSLSESTIAWSTVKHATSADNGLSTGRSTGTTIVDRTFKTHVLENRYLKVTLLPEFGGRILSIIYKPTGHEQLYRTEVGVPYGIKAGNFYYDWLMVYGGIFPTFPDPEHGRAWLKPWDFKVVKQSDAEVTVSMSFKDDFEYSAAPAKFSRGSTGIEASLLCHAESRSRRARYPRGAEKSARQGDPVRILDLHDAGAGIGSEQSRGRPAAPKSSRRSGLQHAALVGQSVRRRRERGRGQEPFRKTAPLQELADDGHRLRRARHAGRQFLGRHQPRQRRRDHPHRRQHGHAGPENVDMGISVVHERNRPRKDPNPQRPYIELWAGVSDQFFHSASFPALGEVSIPETYSPTVGMSNVTHANENILINLAAEGCERESSVLQYRAGHAVARHVETRRRGIVRRRRQSRSEKRQSHCRGNSCRRQRRQVQLTIATAAGKQLIAAETEIRPGGAR